jgi:hypothetical protein
MGEDYSIIETKQMPNQEKLEGIIRLDNLVEDFAPKVVENELGKEKLQELRKTWENQSESISAEASDQEKYEIAYRNFIKKWVTANNLMRRYDGEDGTAKYMVAAIEGWKKQYSNTSLMLRIMRTISPKTAFHKLAKQLAYSLQVFSPFTVTNLDEKQMTLSVNPCKITELPMGNDFCVMACQNIIPVWLDAQFRVKMVSHRKGTDCTVDFAPYDK